MLPDWATAPAMIVTTEPTVLADAGWQICTPAPEGEHAFSWANPAQANSVEKSAVATPRKENRQSGKLDELMLKVDSSSEKRKMAPMGNRLLFRNSGLTQWMLCTCWMLSGLIESSGRHVACW